MRELIVMNRKWSYEIMGGKLLLKEYNNEEKKYCNYELIPFQTSGNSVKDELAVVNFIKMQRY